MIAVEIELPLAQGDKLSGGVVLEMDVRNAVAIDADELGRVAARGVQMGRVRAEADGR